MAVRGTGEAHLTQPTVEMGEAEMPVLAGEKSPPLLHTRYYPARAPVQT